MLSKHWIKHLRENDIVIPTRGTGEFEISGKTQLCLICRLYAKVQVHTPCLHVHACKLHRCLFVKRCITWKIPICSYLNQYFDIAGETLAIPKKLTMVNEFRLIVNFVGKSDCMSTEFRIFRDDFYIFTHYKLIYFICWHLYFSIKNEMLWDA